jgi:hypothetical protein
MNLLTLEEVQTALSEKYREKAAKYPDHFAEMIPRIPTKTQAAEVQRAVKTLTGCDCSADLAAIVSRWDFTHLDVAGYGFGFRGTFAERLVEQNRTDAVNTWWEDAFEIRPPTQLFIAQGDPYVLVLDVKNDTVQAYIADEGAQTAVKIADKLSTCLRMLVTIQLYRPADHGPLTFDEVKGVLGQDCDAQFWGEQIRHWAQFN